MRMKSLEQYRADFIDVIKRQLGAAIRAKGGTVNDTDPFSAFVSAIANMANKRWASGQANSNTSLTSFLHPGGGNSTHYTLSVTGLSFKPSAIFIFGVNTQDISILFPNTLYNTSEKGRVVVTNYSPTATSYFVYTHSIESPIVVDYGTFTMPVRYSGNAYYWYAFE
jgi:hypothetical protein